MELTASCLLGSAEPLSYPTPFPSFWMETFLPIKKKQITNNIPGFEGNTQGLGHLSHLCESLSLIFAAHDTPLLQGQQK